MCIRDRLVREKVIDVTPMTEEQALVQTDLLGHDFNVFENATTGLILSLIHIFNPPCPERIGVS